MENPTPLTPKVSQATFTGFLWGGIAVSFVSVLFRLFVRIKAFRRTWVDDYLVIISWLLFLANAILWQSQVDALYNQFRLSAQTLFPTPEILAQQKVYLRSEVALIALFYSCLYAVKMSFLIFFRRLGTNVYGQRVWWWFVVFVATASWASLIGVIQYPCLLKSIEYIFTQCSTRDALLFEHRTFIYNCVIDVVTDSLIISIPVLILWNVRISIMQKLTLMGIFSLTVIVMVVAIVRVSVVRTAFNVQADQSWLYLWANIEMAVAIIVSCLASFRQLFMKQDKPRYVPPIDDAKRRNGARKLLSSFRSFLPPIPQHTTLGGSIFTSHKAPQMESSSLSKDAIVPLHDIHVSRNINVSSESLEAGYRHHNLRE